MVVLEFILFHRNIFGCSILPAFNMDEYDVPVKKRALSYRRDKDGRKVIHHVKRVLSPDDAVDVEADYVKVDAQVPVTLSSSQFNEAPLSSSQVSSDGGPLNSTVIPDRDVIPHTDSLPSQISVVEGQMEKTPSEADTVLIPCGQGSPVAGGDDSGGISDSQLAEMGDGMENECQQQGDDGGDADAGEGPCLPDVIPKSLFDGHNVANDKIGVFTGDAGEQIMEVGIDRVLTFTYSGEEDIHAYRRIPREGGPPDQSVAISVRRWKKMLEPDMGIKRHIKDLVNGNPVETKIHLGGLFFFQVSQKYKNIQMRQHYIPKNSTKIEATNMGISMSIPEYCYFEELLEEFNSRIPMLSCIVPCYKQPNHSANCVECYPTKKAGNRTDVGFGGGKRFMAQLAGMKRKSAD